MLISMHRFADRDIFVRYYGGGIGHARSSTGAPPSVLTAFDEEDFEWQDVDDPHQDDPGANVGEQSDTALEPSNDADRLRNIIPELVGEEIPMEYREDEEAVDEDKGEYEGEGDLEEQDQEDEESGDSGIDELDGEQAADDMSVDEYDDEGYAPL